MSDRPLQWFLRDADATATAARALAQSRPAKAAVHLHGDLGAGKSTLARAMLRALGVEGPIRSPTYTLVERYRLADGEEALHLDLYRIGDPGELEFLGIADIEPGLWLVEWPERGSGALPGADLHASLSFEGEGRRLALAAGTPEGRAWLTRLVEDGRL